MRFEVISLFPEMFAAITECGITARAHKQGIYSLHVINPREFTHDVHKTVDDRPYGGGPGMVMLAEPLAQAISQAKQAQQQLGLQAKVIHLSPRGERLSHAKVMELAACKGLILLASRYEGVDERVLQTLVDEEISIGDYVLSGGELPAMALIDAIVRQLPGSLGDADSAAQDSFADGMLDCPHYTRPETLQLEVGKDLVVPEVLKSGNHANIRAWRLKQSLALTRAKRPDLLANRPLTKEEARLLKEIEQEQADLQLKGTKGK